MRTSDDNPYTPPAAGDSANGSLDSESHRIGVGRCIFLTVMIAVVSSIPLAGLIGMIFRFPIPMSGYASGPSAFVPGMFAAILYGMVGGVAVQALMGCIAGVIVYQAARRRPQRVGTLTLLGGTLSALPGLLLLATLDWIIGPW